MRHNLPDVRAPAEVPTLDLADQRHEGQQVQTLHHVQCWTHEKGQVERFNSYLKGPLPGAAGGPLEANGLRLDAQNWPTCACGAGSTRWATRASTPPPRSFRQALGGRTRGHAERAGAEGCGADAPGVALPVERLHHPLSVYDALLEVAR
jgi:hypothetical protein